VENFLTTQNKIKTTTKTHGLNKQLTLMSLLVKLPDDEVDLREIVLGEIFNFFCG
jgi:hypothetical protein